MSRPEVMAVEEKFFEATTAVQNLAAALTVIRLMSLIREGQEITADVVMRAVERELTRVSDRVARR